MKGKWMAIAALVVVAVVIISAIGYMMVQSDEDEPLLIDGDTELAEAADEHNWPGSGTEDDPYVISSLEIDVSGDRRCVSISNTTEHVVIQGCQLVISVDEQSSNNGCGIILFQASNVTLKDITIRSVGSGLALNLCDNLDIRRLDVQGTVCELNMNDSNNCTFIDNTFYGEGTNMLNACRGNFLAKNSFTHIEGTGLTVNNCSENLFADDIFKGQVLGAGGTRGMVGLVLNGSDNNSFHSCSMLGSGYMSIGASAIESDGNFISGCNLVGRTGMYMVNSSQNILDFNDFRKASVVAIDMGGSDLNTMSWNFMNGTYSETGIRMSSCDENNVTFNWISGRSSASFLMHLNGSIGNSMAGNTFVYTGDVARTLKLAFDDSGLNVWNDTEMGNQWSDWTSPDADSDGIVDEPYVLEGGAGATDWLPMKDLT